MDDTGNALPGGAVDPHYLVVERRALAVVYSAVNTFPGNAPAQGWVPNSSTSAWIGWVDTAFPGSYGVYTYRTSFTLTAAQAPAAHIKGTWIADQYGQIVLNGQPTGQSVANDNWNEALDPSGTPFVINVGFVPGINTLDFVVTMPDGYDGLRVLTVSLSC